MMNTNINDTIIQTWFDEGGDHTMILLLDPTSHTLPFSAVYSWGAELQSPTTRTLGEVTMMRGVPFEPRRPHRKLGSEPPPLQSPV